MKTIIERLQNGEWFVTCNNGIEFNYLKELCKPCNFKWCDGEDLNDIMEYEFNYPVHIGVDFVFAHTNQKELCYCTTNFNYDRSSENQIEDLTEVIFNKTFYTTKEKEKLDLLLAIIRGEPVEVKDVNDKWKLKTGHIDEVNLKSLLNNYRLPTFNLLIISKEIWNVVDPKFKYAAVDPGKMLWFYEYEPQYREIDGGWNSTKGNVAGGNCFNIDLTKVDYKNSLVQRPE